MRWSIRLGLMAVEWDCAGCGRVYGAGGWAYFLCADFSDVGIRHGFMMQRYFSRMMRGINGHGLIIRGRCISRGLIVGPL